MKYYLMEDRKLEALLQENMKAFRKAQKKGDKYLEREYFHLICLIQRLIK